MSQDIRMEEKISLHNGVMIVGLSGWGNAGEVSTFTVKYLADKLGAKKLGEIPPDQFHVYLIHRPVVWIEQGIVKSYFPPRNDLFYWRNQEGGTDLLLFLGCEPHLNWPRYAEAVLRQAQDAGVKRIYTIGGYLADISHETETLITASTNNKELVAELKKIKVELTNYQGPTSVYSEMLWKGIDRKIDVVSLWCAVPLYVRGVYPEAAYGMLRKITQLIGMELDLRDLEEKAESLRAQLEKEAMDQPQLRDLIESLRRRRQEKEPTYIF